MGHTLKIWKAGGSGTLVTTIPKILQERHNLNEGDIIDIEITKINQKQTTKETTKQKPTKTQEPKQQKTETQRKKININ